eukprot:COSAG01_NODE_64_length_29509_cov_1035.985209_13_plen_1180_part_00
MQRGDSQGALAKAERFRRARAAGRTSPTQQDKSDGLHVNLDDLDVGRRRGNLGRALEEAIGDVETAARIAPASLDDELRELKSDLATFFSLRGLSLAATFKKFDRDGDGSVDRDEFEVGLAELGARLPTESVERLAAMLDKDGDGHIDYVEFARWFGLEPIVVTFDEPGSLGLKFMCDAEGRVLVQEIQPDTQAARAGRGAKGTELRVGLVLRAVGAHDFGHEPHHDLAMCLRMIRAHPQRPLQLRFAQPEVIVTFTEPGSLGLKFTDWIPGQVEVQHIAPHSQAQAHPHMEVGLVLVAVGGTEVAGMTYHGMIDVVKAHRARPLTLRFNKLADIVVSFSEPGSLGLKFATRESSPGQIEISEVQPASHAANQGLRPGLILMRVGVVEVSNLSIAQAMQVIKDNTQRPLALRFNRPVDQGASLAVLRDGTPRMQSPHAMMQHEVEAGGGPRRRATAGKFGRASRQARRQAVKSAKSAVAKEQALETTAVGSPHTSSEHLLTDSTRWDLQTGTERDESIRSVLFQRHSVLHAQARHHRRRQAELAEQRMAVADRIAAQAVEASIAKRRLLAACHSASLPAVRAALSMPQTQIGRLSGLVDAREMSGRTALMIVAGHDSAPCAVALLNAGALVNASGTGGTTALHVAASQGHANVVAVLLAHGANALAETDRGWTARMLAERRGMLEVVAVLDTMRVGGGHAALHSGAANVSQTEALREVIINVLQRQAARNAEVELKKTAGAAMLDLFRVQVGSLHHLAARAEVDKEVRAEAKAQLQLVKWYDENFSDPTGLMAADRHLALVAENLGRSQDKIDAELEAAASNVKLLRRLFLQVDSRRRGRLPQSVTLQLLSILDPAWPVPDVTKVNLHREMNFKQMLHLFVGSVHSRGGIVTQLTKGKYTSPARLVLDVGAFIQLADHTGNGTVDFEEFTTNLLPKLREHVPKKVGSLSVHEAAAVWDCLYKVPYDDPRVASRHRALKQFKSLRGITDAQKVTVTVEGQVDAATLMRSLNEGSTKLQDGTKVKSPFTKKKHLKKRFVSAVLTPCAEAVDKQRKELLNEEERLKPGMWLRALRSTIIRSGAALDSHEVGVLTKGSIVEVLDIAHTDAIVPDARLLVSGSGHPDARTDDLQGWISYTSALDRAKLMQSEAKCCSQRLTAVVVSFAFPCIPSSAVTRRVSDA